MLCKISITECNGLQISLTENTTNIIFLFLKFDATNVFLKSWDRSSEGLEMFRLNSMTKAKQRINYVNVN